MSYLVDKKLSQSGCIKLGLIFQNILKEFILSKKTDIEYNYVILDNQETDHLFITDKIVIYAELKSNLNLDTEKSKSTYDKCVALKNKLQNKYKKHEVKNVFGK